MSTTNPFYVVVDENTSIFMSMEGNLLDIKHATHVAKVYAEACSLRRALFDEKTHKIYKVTPLDVLPHSHNNSKWLRILEEMT